LSLGWVVAVAIALGADAFSVALAIGLTGVSKRIIIRLSLIVAAFHVLMPLVGLLAGQQLGVAFGDAAKMVGALVLIWLGLRMIWHIYRPNQAKGNTDKLSTARSLTGWGPYALGLSVSLDALSVGFSLGTVEFRVWIVLIMGLAAGLMMASGLVLGRVLGTKVGDKAEALGGVILTLIGIRLFF